ncbi:MAG: DUF111 family protein, partial [Chloroflexi bacterium]|nr:DUF111 family protein [Chloroflexota bacterium]
IAITMGDPAGIGPEIVAKSVLERRDPDNLIVVGDPKIIENAFKRLGASQKLHVVHSITSPLNFQDATIVLESSQMTSLPEFGQVNAECGRAAYDAVVKSIELAKAGGVAGIVTAPIHKQALSAAGFKYPGHTEILAQLCGVDDFAMMLYLGPGRPLQSPAGLGVAHATLHTPLGEVPVKLKKLEGKVVQVAPEYEACRKIARETGLPLIEVMRVVSNEATMRGSPLSS